jgi:hypothetical protein
MEHIIELHEKSLEYIEEAFKDYTEIFEDFPTLISGRTVIHLYPTQDTRDSSGELTGYNDALFFDAKIYLTEPKIFFTLSGRGELEIGIHVWTRIFKDRSTMIIIDEDFQLDIFQSLRLRSADNCPYEAHL